MARQYALIGALDARRCAEWAERSLLRTDRYEAVTAEISAAQNISRGRASNQVTVRGFFAKGCLRWRR